MSPEWEQAVVDAQDAVGLGRWWQHALGWTRVNVDPDDYEIRPSPDRLPGLLSLSVREAKSGKNRLHPDFRPDDRDGEVKRLLDLGATLVDIGRRAQSWAVLADREGNEFCVLGSKKQTS